MIEWGLGVEIPDTTKIGAGFTIHHGIGLVLNPNVEIGDNVTLRHNTTIGNKLNEDGLDLGSPKILDNVDVGAGAIILGPITIGFNSVIGAGAVIIKDVPDYAVVVGNPGKVIRYIKQGK